MISKSFRYVSAETDPGHNLALEEALLETAGADERFLLVYRNDPCIIIGRHQNPWREVAPPVLRSGNPPVLRRISGGGTVYHDLGNLNCCLIGPSDLVTKEADLELVTAALRRLGLKLEASSHGDLLWEGRKVSGSAYRRTRGKTLHHMTLLISADLMMLGKALGGIEVLGPSTASRPAPVANLSQALPGLTPDQVVAALFEEAGERWGGTTPLTGSGEGAEAGRLAGDLRGRAARYRSWEWTYGATPDFRFSLKDKGALAVVHEGLLQAFELTGSGTAGLPVVPRAFDPDKARELCGQMLQGVATEEDRDGRERDIRAIGQDS